MNEAEKYLQSKQIDYIRHDHPPVFTCEEADEHCAHIPGLHCKNLFLRNKDKSKHYLIVMPAAKRADLKKIRQTLEEKKISFANADTLRAMLKLEPGSVSPFGLINDPEQKVTVYVDREVYGADCVNFHPNDNRASLELSKEMFHKYLDEINHEIHIIE